MKNLIPRDISWLSFNGRVLQEAADKNVPLHMRIKFLGIFSNNLDEFFRVRVAGLKRATMVSEKDAIASFFEDPNIILDKINDLVIEQRNQFGEIWLDVQKEMAAEGVYLKTPEELNPKQLKYIKNYYQDEIESNVIPLLLDEKRSMPYLRDKSLYLGIAMRKTPDDNPQYAIIEVPTSVNGRFIKLPSPKKEKHVILLEDILRVKLPMIFSYFGVEHFSAHAFKVTKDAEFDIDNDINTSLAEKIAKGVKNRRKGKPTRFVYDKNIDKDLLDFLIYKLHLSKKDSIIPGAKIHNFKHFMDFPNLFKSYSIPAERKSFTHPALKGASRITDVILKKDVLLSFPYHSFRPIIDLLREAAIDPEVESIQITAYRLAPNSKIANALINASRNGKEVIVMLELQARFDEENNLDWKEKFEMEGIQVLVGIPNKKVHAKLCVIKKIVLDKPIFYGFVSTGNINEKTAKLYGDYCLLTRDKNIMSDIKNIFKFLKSPSSNLSIDLQNFNNLLVCPTTMRDRLYSFIDQEIKAAKEGKKSHIIVKVNSLSDKRIIEKIYTAADAGVKIDMIVRGIFCAKIKKSFSNNINAISIVDEFLEHARVIYFYNNGAENIFLSSADWMTRNLDHRIEAAVEIKDSSIKEELKTMLQIQLKDNVKARILDNAMTNQYVQNKKENCRSQIEIHKFLRSKKS